MSAKAQLRGSLINSYLNSRVPIKRTFHRAVGARRAVFYYRPDDPYSHLLLQRFIPLVQETQVQSELVVIPTPTKEVNPAPEMLTDFALSDAKAIAAFYGLSFPTTAVLPAAPVTRLAQAVLLKKRPAAEQLQAAQQVGEALWRGDDAALQALADRLGSVSEADIDALLATNQRRLRRAGHYLSAVISYEGQWYWGIDRLPHLEAQLLNRPLPSPPNGRSAQPGVAADQTLEVFFSFRSPYSYIALTQLDRLRDNYGVQLRLRPVLPMVMRGLPVPAVKRLYIVHDAKREADRLGVPFGRICDPLGKGIGRCIALCIAAAEQGRDLAFAQAVMRGIWAEAKDVADDAELFELAQSVGFDRGSYDEALANPGWKAVAQGHRDDLTALGLWGVPCFRLGEYATWGQDRLPLIEAKLRDSSK